MSAPDIERLEQLKSNLKRRAVIINSVRSFFRRGGSLEVETPLRVPQIAPEIQIVPFTSEGFFLSTSPELYMKRLVSAGYDKIFQLTKSFRKAEKGKLHQPEFTILEWYRAHAGYNEIIQDTENLIISIARKLKTYPMLRYQGKEIDLTPPFPRITVREAFLKSAGYDPTVSTDNERFEDTLVNKVIPSFPEGRPLVLMNYPAYCASLSRLKPGDPSVAERAEVFIGGLEIANIYSELTNPEEQEKHFRKDIEELNRMGRTGYKLPQKFLEALQDFPECGGVALGIDRLVMLFCDAKTIYDVIAFPHLEEGGLEG